MDSNVVLNRYMNDKKSETASNEMVKSEITIILKAIVIIIHQYIMQQESVFLLFLSNCTYNCNYYSLSLINSFIVVLGSFGSSLLSIFYLYLNNYLFALLYMFDKN